MAPVKISYVVSFSSQVRGGFLWGYGGDPSELLGSQKRWVRV